jgi:signal transduction histidine kinase
MSPREKLASAFGEGRPVLRVQLTALYSGLVLGLLAAALLATNVFYGHSSASAPNGAPAAPGGSGRSFDIGPAVIGLIAAIIALAGAWWLAGRFLRPLRAMTATARQISATNLNRRLSVSGPDDELTELGRTLDDLFARLEASFASQRHFVANASHELRTPLAGQRTLLQVALADPGADARTLRSTCEQALALGAQQERLIDALLTLTTSERGVERWELVELGALAERAELGRARDAERAGVEIHAELEVATAIGDERLVESLIANLVDNAIVHNRPGGKVLIATYLRAGRATISVANSGATIPPGELERLFEPFARLGVERTGDRDRHGLGLGLGLAIVRAIAAAHGATLDARVRPEGGLAVTVGFPGRATCPGRERRQRTLRVDRRTARSGRGERAALDRRGCRSR